MRIGTHKNFGSSFDKMEKSHEGQKMDVLNRWKDVKDNPKMQELMKNKTVFEYAEALGFDMP